MSPEAYKAMQDRVELLSRLILDTSDDELREFVEAIDRADTLGPLMDPTAWMRGADKLAMVRAHASAIHEARHAIEDAAARAGAAR